MIGEKWVVIVDGKESKEYDEILPGNPVFSPDSKNVIYAAKYNNKTNEDNQVEAYTSQTDPQKTRKHDKSFFTYTKPGKWTVVINGKEGKQFDNIKVIYNGNQNSTFKFSPDNKSIMYTAMDGGKELNVVDKEK